ncbi:MAG: transposase, partial [Deltaproteobacteria bacterium]|nr:transposase [Deltaproteobacteria bacterium]
MSAMDESGRPLPKYVRSEFECYLDCGILARGFVRATCAACGFDRLVAFACKSRSFCPACAGRFMNETALFWVDSVIGPVPVRQWVLSLPHPLRYLVAYDKSLCTAVLGAFIRSVFGWLRRTAKKELGLRSVHDAHPAAATVVQRASSHLALNPHFHTLAADGVYVEEQGRLVFRALPQPTPADVAQVAWDVCRKTLAVLSRRGMWLDQDPAEDRFAQDEPGLAACYAASMSGALLVRKDAQPRPMSFYALAASDGDKAQAGEAGYGFNVHAGVRIRADDRSGLERLCRYVTRPALSQRRLAMLPSGDVQLALKKPWSDGTTSVVFEPLAFMARLASMVPPPRMHRTRYHGLWAPHAARRAEWCRRSRKRVPAGTRARTRPWVASASGTIGPRCLPACSLSTCYSARIAARGLCSASRSSYAPTVCGRSWNRSAWPPTRRRLRRTVFHNKRRY